MLTNKPLTKRGHAKRQEKELKWEEIPDRARLLFKEAEKVQWDEHLTYDALEPLSLEESQAIKETVSPDRILPCRWAYRDKNWAARQATSTGESEPAWRCKSRLVIGGHRDPDLGVEPLCTDAPTLSRPGFMCLMQLLANGLKAEDKWMVAAGDIQCAFLTGGYLARGEDLYLHQPRTPFPGLLPGQLVRIRKNIFGLATSPHEWWVDLQNGMGKARVGYQDKEFRIRAVRARSLHLRPPRIQGRPVCGKADRICWQPCGRHAHCSWSKGEQAYPACIVTGFSHKQVGGETTWTTSAVRSSAAMTRSSSPSASTPKHGCSAWRSRKGSVKRT